MQTNNTSPYIKEIIPKYVGQARKGPKITDSEDCVKFLRDCLGDENKEHFIALYLDGAHQVITYSIVSIGTLNAASIHPREVFRPAILCASAAVIVAHNHPSGQLVPSKEDITVTKRLKECGDLLGIKLLDHIIFTQDSSKSLNAEGLMQ